MQNFYKYIIEAVKFLFVILLIFVAMNIAFAPPSEGGVKFMAISILLVALFATIFVFYIKEYVKDNPRFIKFWRIGKYLYMALMAMFFIFVALSMFLVWSEKSTEESVGKIENIKITMSDVIGENLPPVPDQQINDSTVEGIDANNNYIRDDVELAIFERYPDSAKIRSAMLQYAQALQLQLTEVYDSKTLVATLQKENSAYFCLGDADDEKLRENETFIEDLVVNTDLREKAMENAFEYMTTYSLPKNDDHCDLRL